MRCSYRWLMVWPSGGNCPAPTRCQTCAGGWRGVWHKDLTVTPAAKKAVTEFVGCACAPFLCPGYVVRGAHPTSCHTEEVIGQYDEKRFCASMLPSPVTMSYPLPSLSSPIRPAGTTS